MLPAHFCKLNACSDKISNILLQLAKILRDISEHTALYVKGIPKCDHQELATNALLHHIREYPFLFSLRRMNIAGIYEWCREFFWSGRFAQRGRMRIKQ